MVLVGAAADPLVRLQLGERLLPPPESVQREPEHLPYRAGPGCERFRFLGLGRRALRIVAIEKLDRPSQSTVSRTLAQPTFPSSHASIWFAVT